MKNKKTSRFEKIQKQGQPYRSGERRVRQKQYGLGRSYGEVDAVEFFADSSEIFIGAYAPDGEDAPYLRARGAWVPLAGRVKKVVDRGLYTGAEERCLVLDGGFQTAREAIDRGAEQLAHLMPEKQITKVWSEQPNHTPASHPKDPLSLPLGWRSDAPLIKFLHEQWGAETARCWQAMTLVDFRHESDRIVAMEEQLEREVPTLSLRPFESCVIDLGLIEASTPSDPEHFVSARAWSLVTPLSRFIEVMGSLFPQSKAIPGLSSLSNVLRADALVLQTFIRLVDGGWFNSMPFTAIVESDDWTADPEVIIFGKDQEARQQSESALALLVSTAIAYLCAPPDQLVEVVPAPSRDKRDGKDAKPWTKRLPSIRVLNPHTVKRSRAENPHGTHASPIHHHRRGGFVTLLHPRYYQRWEDVKSEHHSEFPPHLPTLSYREQDFVAGMDERGRAHVFRRSGLVWEELSVRLTHRRETYVGPREFDDELGNIYRVLASQVPESI